MTPKLKAKPNSPVPLEPVRNWPKSVHIFDRRSIAVVEAALATGRPLLVRGEPGTGKSQLARAVAADLNWPFLSTVVNARFEPEDLLYRYDAVARLAEAQVVGHCGGVTDNLAPSNFLIPQILWWAFSPSTAERQRGVAIEHCGQGCEDWSKEFGEVTEDETPNSVVLIDEIDKAESDLPNSLLEALSLNGFQLPFGGETVSANAEGSSRPLIVITTNEDRELPPAFVRRCWVLNLDPDAEEDIDAYFRTRAEAHFKEKPFHKDVLDTAIEKLREAREAMGRLRLTKPGLAEFLDLLRAVEPLPGNQQSTAISQLAEFALAKHRDED